MITPAVRLEWRRIFTDASDGPWAHNPPGSSRVTAMSGGLVAAFSNHWDADFCARARSEWPAALEALEQAERERDIAKQHAERLDALVTEATNTLAGLVDKVTLLTEQARVASDGERTIRKAYDAALGDYRELLGRVMGLEHATSAWRKHRHSPTLLRALDAYDRTK